MVAAAPGARLLQFDQAGYREVSWEALESVQLYRRFLAGPSAFLARETDGRPRDQ